MKRVFTAPLTVLFELQSILERLFILTRKVIDAMAVGAFEFDEVVLGHEDG